MNDGLGWFVRWKVSGHWKKKSCAVNYNDECFGVFHRARTKQHLVVLEALFILFYWPTLCMQSPKHSLNLLGDNCCSTQGGF